MKTSVSRRTSRPATTGPASGQASEPTESPCTNPPAGRPGRKRLLAVIGLVLVIALWASSLRQGAGPAAGAAFEGNSPLLSTATTKFRLGLFNIHGGRDPDGTPDLSRTAECLRGCDFVGLNEVLGPKPWQSQDQAHKLGELLGLRWMFAPTESRWWDGSFGNAALSGLPVRCWQRIPLPLAGSHTHRNMLLSTFEVGGRRVNSLLVHLDSRDALRRQEQLRTAGELFLSLAEPAILLGDLNTTAADPVLGRLLSEPGVDDAVVAGGVPAEPHRIDWILARGLDCRAAGCEDRGASDHPCYWVDFELRRP